MTAESPGTYQCLLVLLVAPLSLPAPANKLRLRMCLGPEAKWAGMASVNTRCLTAFGLQKERFQGCLQGTASTNTKMCPRIVRVQHCLDKDEFTPGKVLVTGTDVHSPVLGSVPRHVRIYSHRHSPEV